MLSGGTVASLTVVSPALATTLGALVSLDGVSEADSSASDDEKKATPAITAAPIAITIAAAAIPTANRLGPAEYRVVTGFGCFESTCEPSGAEPWLSTLVSPLFAMGRRHPDQWPAVVHSLAVSNHP